MVLDNLPSYSIEELQKMLGRDGIVRMRKKRRKIKSEEKTVPWSDLDFTQIPELQGKGYDEWFDKPHIMRHIIQKNHPGIIEQLKEKPPKKKEVK